MSTHPLRILSDQPESPVTPPWPSPTEDLVEIPAQRRHDGRAEASIVGIVVTTVLTIVGAIAVGAGYGATIALCSNKIFNIGIAFSFPFWMHAPAFLGSWISHFQNQKLQTWIGVIGFMVCFYAVVVGWLAAILDGPGIVLNPLLVIGHFVDVSNHSLWTIPFEQDLTPLAPYLLAVRFGELFWIAHVGIFTIGVESPYPYCGSCKRWIDDEAKIRLRYDPPLKEDVRVLAAKLVAGQYEPLFSLDQTVEPKAKGLECCVYGCEGCGEQVLDVTWYRTTPDPEKKEVEQMLEAGTGTKLVSRLRVPAEVRSHIAHLAKAQTEPAQTEPASLEAEVGVVEAKAA